MTKSLCLLRIIDSSRRAQLIPSQIGTDDRVVLVSGNPIGPGFNGQRSEICVGYKDPQLGIYLRPKHPIVEDAWRVTEGRRQGFQRCMRRDCASVRVGRLALIQGMGSQIQEEIPRLRPAQNKLAELALKLVADLAALD